MITNCDATATSFLALVDITGDPQQSKEYILLNSAHLNEPVLFETRWAMSYLKGPITKGDIKRLMAPMKTETGLVPGFSAVDAKKSSQVAGGPGMVPVVPSKIEQFTRLKM